MDGFLFLKKNRQKVKNKILWLFLFLSIWALGINLSLFDSFHRQTFMGLAFLNLFMSWYMGKNLHWSAGLGYGYFMISSALKTTFAQSFWPNFQLEEIVGFESLVQASQVYVILISMFFMLSKKDFMDDIKLVLLSFGILDSIVLSIRWWIGLDPYYLFNNAAIDASYIACCIPMISQILRKHLGDFLYVLLLMAFAAPCIFTKTSSGVLGACLFLALRFGEVKGMLLAMGSAVLGFILQRDELFNSSGRFNIWTMAMKYWAENVNPFLGSGLGTFQMLGPAIQISDAIKKGQTDATLSGFFWMHNDWLQILFESGIFGFLIAGLVYGIALKKAKETTFQVLIIFGAMALIQMPLRHIIFTCFGAYILVDALGTTEKRGSN